MQTATSEMESKSRDQSTCVHLSSLRAPCPKGQGTRLTPVGNAACTFDIDTRRELANGEFETCFCNVCPIWRWPDIGGNAVRHGGAYPKSRVAADVYPRHLLAVP